ncbi:MAG: mechanosensitive ion channel family protein [Halothiobacillaceae bacterium]|nr:mechanosensitive ion channel family protein [Halothiobacillaceae bacterium]
MDFLRDFTFGNLGGAMPWIAQVFIVITLALVLSFFQGRLLAWLHERLRRNRYRWDDAVVHALRRPLTLLIWALGLTFAIDIIHAATAAPIFAIADPVRDVGVILSLGWFLIRLIGNMQEAIIARQAELPQGADRHTVEAIAKLLRISVLITAGLVILQTLGFSISGVLAFGGIGGIAVGFAAKDLLANFFGGLTIYLDRPFQAGDWIRSPDKQIEGTVEEIGWRLTRIRTFDKRPLYVPNSLFTTIAIENPSRMTHRRINETIGLRYDDIACMGPIVEDVKAMLRAHPEIDDSQTLIVNFNQFGPSSLDFFIYTFTHTTQWVRFHEIKQDVLLKVAEIIQRHGAQIAFPTQTLHLVGEAPPLPETSPSVANATGGLSSRV